MQITPKMQHILKILVPMILPIKKSEVPLNEAEIDNKSSGRLVPTQTIVRPIRISLILNILPILVPTSINTSEPFIKSINPVIISMIAKNIYIFIFSLVYMKYTIN